MVVERSVCIGNQIVGTVSVDPFTVRGIGGPIAPRLVVPLRIALHPQTADHQLAVLRLDARLHAGEGHDVVLAERSLSLAQGMHCRSVNTPNTHHIEIDFSLSPHQVAYLEKSRHRADGMAPQFTLELIGPLVWLSHTGNTVGLDEKTSTLGEGGWSASVGLWSEVAVFWNSQWANVTFPVSNDTWIEQILPAWGIDRYRVMEVQFPESDASIAKQWDRAWSAYQSGHYADSVSSLRGIFALVNKSLGATKQRRVADVIGQRHNWAPDDVRHRLLDNLWQSLKDCFNTELHPEGGQSLEWTADDAQLLLTLVSSLVQYVV